jgi:hypothetical protein
MNDNTFELYAIVELFGHQKVAGKVSEQAIGSSTFVRIDVPETQSAPPFTRFVNPSAVYAINPVTEEVMLARAENIQAQPIDAWDIRRMHEKLLLLGQQEPGNDDFGNEN